MSYDPTIFNVDPYYDDYDANNKFIRMLFRPGYAVQARELTQLQSILQNQIQRFGDNVFEDGSIVLGGEVVENRIKYARVTGLTGTLDIADTIGTVLTVSGRANAKIVHAEGGLSSSTVDNMPVIFYEYTSGGTAFSSNLSVGGTANNGSAVSMTISGVTSGSLTGYSIGDALLIHVASGVRYVESFFVANDQQTIGAYSLTGASGSNIRVFDDPTTRIGFVVNRQFISSEDNETLKDPAFGFYNYSAPGADRYKIDLDITQYPFSPTDTSTTENFSRENFVEFLRVLEGDVIKKEFYPSYAVIGDTLARRTYDESGNYIVEPFSLSPTEGVFGLTGATLSAEIGPGKAYVFGYEFETQGITKISLPKARTYRTFEDARISSVVGPYVLGELNPNGLFPSLGLSSGFDIATSPSVVLASSRGTTGASAYAPIGSAKVRGVEYKGGAVGQRWRVDLFDISMSGGNPFSNTRSIFTNNIVADGKQLFELYSTTGGAELQDFSNTLLFPHTAGVGTKRITDVDYQVRMNKQVKFDATGTAQLSISNIGFGSDSAKAYFNYPSGVYSPDNTFSVISISGNSVTNAYAKGDSSTYGILYITAGPTGVTATVNYEVALKGSGGSYLYRTKTLTSVALNVTGPIQYEVGPTGSTSSGKQFVYLNKYVDVASITSITGGSGNLNTYFVLDNGQRDNYYDWAKLILAPGYTAGSVPGGITSGMTVNCSYYARPTSGATSAPFTVDSYNMPLEQIPSYSSPDTGNTYKLSDMIDFRSDKMPDGTFMPNTLPSDTTVNFITVENYLPRTDKIVLTRNKEFKLISGIPEIGAPTPPDDANSMTLYTLYFAPYTNTKDDVSIRAQTNKRYTMEDIGNLEKRIDAVEYYTSLNLLEQEAKNTVIEDGDGVVVPKKGILVDSFRGHNVADVKSLMFNAAIDPQNTVLRPAFRSKIYRVDVDSRAPASSLISPAGLPGATADRLYTIDYTEVPGIVQPSATTSRMLNPFGVFNYMGSLKLNPDSDFWMADTKGPAVRVNIFGERDNWSYSVRGSSNAEGGTGPGQTGGFGTQWNDWESNWFGRNNLDETTQILPNKSNDDMSVSANFARYQGLLSSKAVTPESITQNSANSKINKDVDYYARNIYILLAAEGLRPSTQVYAFVDGATTPSTIYTVTPGATAGAYTINSSVSSVVTNSSGSMGIDSPYYAILLNETGSVKVGPKLIRVCDSSTNDITAVTTSAEKIFSSEGYVESKEGDVGIVSTRKSVSYRKSVNDPNIENNVFTKQTSSTASSRGKVDPLSQSFRIDPVQYPYGLFAKSVTLWFSSIDSSYNAPVTLMLKPLTSGYPHPSKVLPIATTTVYSNNITTTEYATGNGTKFQFSSPIYLAPGYDYCFSLKTSSNNFSLHSAKLGDTLYRATENDPIYSATSQPGVGSLFAAQGQNTLSKIENEDLKFIVNICQFTTAGSPVLRMSNIANTYYGSENINPAVVRFQIPTMTPPGTSISIEEEGILSASNTKVLLNKNTNRRITTNIDPNTKFTSIYAYLNTTNKWVSPVVDLDRGCILSVENLINNNKVGTQNDNGEESSDNRGVDSTARSKSRYISKKVNLDYPSTRLDVFLTISNPTPSSVEVYARTLPDESNSDTYLETRGYQKMSASTSANTPEGEFQEVRYTLILSEKDKFSTFAIKIVMNSSVTNVVPVIQTMRVIST
jgi:hypothetical protein